MAILGLEPPQFFAFDPDTGQPLIGGKVYTYEPGTTTDKIAYRDQAGAVAHTNPIILGQLGNATIFGDGLYDIHIYDADDVLVLTLSDFAAPITEADVDDKIADAIASSSLGYGAQTVGTSSTLSTTAAAKLVKVDATAGNITLTLPSASTMLGRAPITITRTDSTANEVLIDPNGSELIEGAANLALVPGSAVQIWTDGAAWFTTSVQASKLVFLEDLVTAGGTANALTLTTAYSWSAPRTGEPRTFRASAANTGAATLQVGAQSAIDLRKIDATNAKVALDGAEIQIGGVYDVVFDGTHWVLLPPYGLIGDFDDANASQAPHSQAVKDLSRAVMIVREEQTAGTDGGGFTSGAWQTRVLNTVQINNITGASLASNQITLPAGTYEIMGSAPANRAAAHQARLRNITDSAATLIGTSEVSNTANRATTRSRLEGIITIADEKVFEVQHQCQTTRAADGLGDAGGFTTEVYSTITIRKLA